MKIFLALVFAVGCAANVQDAYFAVRRVVLHAHSKLDHPHRKLIDENAAAMDKCMEEVALPASCVTAAKAAMDIMSITPDMVNQMCTGNPSCSSQIGGMYNSKILPCMEAAIKNATGGSLPSGTGDTLKKMGDMFGNLMCIKDAQGSYCMPKLATMGKDMATDIMGDMNMPAGGMPDMGAMMAKMCGKMSCLGSCLTSMMSFMGDMMGGTDMPAGMDLSTMCAGVTCPGAGSAGTSSVPFVVLTAFLAMAVQLFAR
jgi:hypothetical protein